MVVFRAPPYQMFRICTTTRRNLLSAIEHLPPLQTIVFEARQFHLHSADVPDPNPQMDAVHRCVRENLSNPCQVPKSFAHAAFQPTQVPCITVGFPYLRAKYPWQLGTSAFGGLLLPVLCAEIPGPNPWVDKHDFTLQASATQLATPSSYILVLYKSSRSKGNK